LDRNSRKISWSFAAVALSVMPPQAKPEATAPGKQSQSASALQVPGAEASSFSKRDLISAHASLGPAFGVSVGDEVGVAAPGDVASGGAPRAAVGSGDAADDEGEEHAAPARKITRALARRTGDATRGG
jgi:hypothetical protein